MASYAADFAKFSDDVIREYEARRALMPRVKREVDEIRSGAQDLVAGLHDDNQQLFADTRAMMDTFHDDNQQLAADTRAMLADFRGEFSAQARALRQRLHREHRELLADTREQQAERRAEADELSAAARTAFAAIQRCKGAPSGQVMHEVAAKRTPARAGASKRRPSKKR